MTTRPPALPQWLLARALPRDGAASAVLGDLREDFARIARSRGAVASHVWYWRHALPLTLSLITHRVLDVVWPRHRDVTGDGSMTDSFSTIGIAQDARYACRAVRKDMAFFAFATLIVALGVGASTAVFSVMSPLMVRSLPFPEPERLVWIANSEVFGGMSAVTSRTSNLRDFRALATSFDGLTGYNAFFQQGNYNLTGEGQPERLVGVDVAHDFLDVLGVQPLHGRNFTLEEGAWDGPQAVILSYGFWTQRFAADPSIVGRSITISDIPRQVVGVLPPSFDFAATFLPTARVDFLRTFAISKETDDHGNTMSFIGRLRPGVTVETAQAELDTVVAALQAADPERWGLGASVKGLQNQLAGPFRSAMWLLAAAAAAIMLIVCVNLSNLLLAKAPRRAKEMAVRTALGATRGRLLRQLLIESLLLAASGAMIGLTIAAAATRAVAGSTSFMIPLLHTVSVDGSALAFTSVLAIVTGLLVGIVPALQISEGGGVVAMKASSRAISSTKGNKRLREGLVVAEVALACVLLVCGGLLLKSFQRVLDVDLGFQPAGLLAWQLGTSRSFDNLAGASALFDDVVTNVAAIPGVEAVGLTDETPLGRNRTWTMTVPGVVYEEGAEPEVFPHMIDSRYLQTMGIPLVSGRYFTPDDTEESVRVMLLNETAASVLFPGQDPLGRIVNFGEWTVVGVVGDVRHQSLELGSGAEMYLPYMQLGDFRMLDMVVRSPLPLEALRDSVAAVLRAADPAMPTDDIESLDALVDRSVSSRRFTLMVLSAFATAALLLAALGIYGVLSYSVTERIPEIGIRMALGESAAKVRQRVLGRTLAIAGIGAVVGTAAAFASSRLIGTLLYGVEPTDPTTFVAMAAALLLASALAGYIPARRASRTNPVKALQA